MDLRLGFMADVRDLVQVFLRVTRAEVEFRETMDSPPDGFGYLESHEYLMRAVSVWKCTSRCNQSPKTALLGVAWMRHERERTYDRFRTRHGSC